MSDTGTIMLGHIKDIRAALRNDPDTKYAAQIEGHVWRKRIMKNTVFLDITDGTGAIQIVCSRDRFEKETWKAIHDLSKGSHIDVQGKVGITSRAFASVFAEHVTVRLTPVLLQNGQIEIYRVKANIRNQKGWFFLNQPLSHRIGNEWPKVVC